MDFYWNILQSWLHNHITLATFNYLSSTLFIDTSTSSSSLSTTTANSNLLSSPLSSPSPSNAFQRQRHFNTTDGNCPICLNSFLLPVETNCGHMFCGQCIVIYWQQSHWRGGPIKCPVCRQQVNILLPCFNRNILATNNSNATIESSELNLEEQQTNVFPTSNGSANLPEMARQLINDINRYNRKFSGEPRRWLEYLYDLPTMLRHLSNDFFSFNGLFYMFRIRVFICVLAAIMYLISPLDMIPEAVFGIFGLVDDIIVVVLLAIYVTIIYRRFLSTRWNDDL